MKWKETHNTEYSVKQKPGFEKINKIGRFLEDLIRKKKTIKILKITQK